MSAVGEQREPAAVRLARHSNEEVGRLAAGIVAIADGVRGDLAVIAKALDVELPERLDPEAIAWARRRAAAEDRQAAIERTKAQMDEARMAAKRQSGLPPIGRRDGTRVNEQDLKLAAHERDSFLIQNGFSQAARHAAMAQIPIPYTDDAHHHTRHIRARMYETLAEESKP